MSFRSHVLSLVLLSLASRAGADPVLAFPSIDPAALLQRDAERERAGPGPLRFAEPIDVLVTPDTDGAWAALPDGSREWRLSVHVPGATDLNFGFGRYELPAGATLSVTDGTGAFELGPHGADDGAAGQLWTALVPGDRATLKLLVPAGAAEPVLELSRVGAGYRDATRLVGTPVPLSGACNNDVACPEGDPWRAEIRSAIKYSIRGTDTCSGTLIADVPGSFRPFILTANHCGLDAANAPTVVTYWNYQASACGGPRDGFSNAVTQSGATFRASLRSSDMALIELTQAPVAGSNAYWSGWDRGDVPPSAAVAIHHPSLDEKAITFEQDALTRTENCIENPGAYPDTHWWVDRYEDGTTEPGSSGSGIWDANSHLLVGTLSGGGASCGSVLNGDPNDDYDCWGRFGRHWDSGASSAQRLRDWLDPAGTGATSVPGAELVTTQLVLDGFDIVDTCALGAGDRNGLAEPAETITLIPRLRAEGTDYSVLRGTLGTVSPAVTMIDGSATWPDLPSGTTSASDPPHFRFQVVAGAACGTRIPFTLSVTTAQGGPFDLPLEIVVGAPAPRADAPLAIPDGGAVTSDLVIAQDVTFTSFAVRAEIVHTWVGDLRIDLRAPSGRTVTLLDRPGVPASGTGCADENMNVTFTDAGPFALENHCAGTNPWYEGQARATTSLAGFVGERSAGTWTLTVTDGAPDDQGTLVDWELITTPALTGACTPCASCAGQVIASAIPDVLRVRKGAAGTLILTHPGAASACASGVQVRMSSTPRPAVAPGSFPADPAFADVSAQDLDPGAAFRHDPGAGNRYYLVVEDLAGAPGPSGSYGY